MGGKKSRRRERSPSGSSMDSHNKDNNKSGNSSSDILGEIRKLAGTVSTQGNNLANQVQGVANKLDSMDNRLAAVETSVSECQGTLEKHERDIAFLLQHVKQIESSKEGLEQKAKDLETRLAVAEQVEPIASDSNFDRPPNPTVVKANAKVHLSKEAVTAAFATLVEKVSLPADCFKVNGSPVGQYFTFQFLGAPNLARDRARKVLQSLRQEDGSWDRFLVKNPEGSLVQVFLGPDKSPKQVKTEILSKKLAAIIEAKGFNEVHANRRQGQVCVSWRPLCMVEITGRESADILWDTEYAVQIKIDRASVHNAFQTASISTAASSVKWERLQES